jgi:hypothetical protein
VTDGSAPDGLAREVPATEATERPTARTDRPRGTGRRARRWSRTGTPSAFGIAKRGSQVGWSWEIRADGTDHRRIHVQVIPGPYRVTDLPAESRNAIRSRGATAVDAFLETDDPPVRIVVSTQGLQAYYSEPRSGA